jgi:CDP-diacylglycerol--glycerol-3-phosphate 3-phosphatidyltransferase
VQKEKIMTLANILSFSRFFFGIAFLAVFIAVKRGDYDAVTNLVLQGVSILIFTIAIITDGLDGWVARRSNQVTNLGKHLDPLADSIFFIIVFSTFTVIGLMPWYFLVPVVLREGFMHLYLRPYFKRNNASLPANMYGKVKTFMQCTFSLILICGLMALEIASLIPVSTEIQGAMHSTVKIASFVFFSIIVFLSLYSLWTYLVRYVQFRKTGK